ncbi:DUF3993 domain-containing protein [Bacillus sp. ISL-47]|uniref:DUF3993 domain-containing protein n=1 Tax=Bacillus sp. ISL-47 TaxID=2819130 RepID=UPI001BE7A3C2|nr:DUF3993 domain-containing protein [Bacillus sp. ISL-47]MBT2687830.1 DUF3993 domain-containing protein [Bacillus sp. ISL-47]MBT2708093.1 DUF3993 domain-containing protein [Pseudomonas sp. ISL-84]
MYKHLLGFLFTLAAIFAVMPSHPNAESGFSNNEDVYKFLQDAFQAQVSLSEEERSLEDVNELLAPYFSGAAKKQFLEENLVSENGKYMIYGSDAANFYIPFFTYSEETKIVTEKEKVYVFEYFPENEEGPVGYESHYEGVLLEKNKGKMKVAQFLGDKVPENILEKVEKSQQESEQTSFKTAAEPVWFNKPAYQITFLLNPFDAFLRSGSMLFTDDKQGVMALFENQEINGQLASN